MVSGKHGFKDNSKIDMNLIISEKVHFPCHSLKYIFCPFIITITAVNNSTFDIRTVFPKLTVHFAEIATSP
jgi:hypothetical protein